MTTPDFQIEYATRADLPAIADIHKQGFPDSFSTQLGKAFREKMLEWYFSTDKTFILVARTTDGRVAGYVTGMVKDGVLKTGSASGMAQYSFNQGMISLALRPWLLFHKEMRRKFLFIIRNIKRRFTGGNTTKPGPKSPQPEKPTLGLVIIAVSSAFAGMGVGSALMRGFENVAVSDYHIPDVYLTVEIHNQRAMKTYERAGWVRMAEEGGSYRYGKHL